MADYYTLLTTIGRAKLANAHVTGVAVQITEFAVGDGGGAVYNPAEDATGLVGETFRAAPNQIYTDPDNPAWLVIEAVVPETTGGFYVREAGVFDIDGDMIAIAKYPETYKPTLAEGSGKDLYVRMVLEFSNTSDVVLKIDPAIVLATRNYVDTEVTAALTAHAGSRDHPEATVNAQGMVELATPAEAVAGVDATRAVTPLAATAAVQAAVTDHEAAGNPHPQYAGAGDLSAALAAHAASRDHPAATTGNLGLARLATDAEARGLSSTVPAVTPAGVGAALADLGLGLPESANPQSIADLDDVSLRSGLYYSYVATAGAPAGANTAAGVVLYCREYGGRIRQILLPRGSGEIWTRDYDTSQWGGWSRIGGTEVLRRVRQDLGTKSGSVSATAYSYTGVQWLWTGVPAGRRCRVYITGIADVTGSAVDGAVQGDVLVEWWDAAAGVYVPGPAAQVYGYGIRAAAPLTYVLDFWPTHATADGTVRVRLSGKRASSDETLTVYGRLGILEEWEGE